MISEQPIHFIERTYTTQIKDAFSLCKPRILLMELLTTAFGIFVSPLFEFQRVVWALIGTALVVSSANVLNMYVERHIDSLMSRTRFRPLPDGRLTPSFALSFGLLLMVMGALVLWVAVNQLTAVCGLIALVSYVWIYTPLKQKTPHSLVIGAIPGAMPALIGWTAMTGTIAWPGVLLFLIVFFWQIPHFIAISFYLNTDYEKAGIKTLVQVHGDRVAKIQAIVYTLILIFVSLLVVQAKIAGWVYFISACSAGGWFFMIAMQGLRQDVSSQWARKFFLTSLVYFPIIAVGFVLDRLIQG